tara:strand:+ start:299 stop:706 length:408 start_codon:yes stop_codon:yes gene_type:complete
MVTFRNNNGRRNNFRRNERNFKSNGERNKFNSFSTTDNFQRKSPGRNNHNAPKLIEKYNNLAREALSTGDKILSENYFQHADHFTRILNEREIQKKTGFKKDLEETNNSNEDKEKKGDSLLNQKDEVEDKPSEIN